MGANLKAEKSETRSPQKYDRAGLVRFSTSQDTYLRVRVRSFSGYQHSRTWTYISLQYKPYNHDKMSIKSDLSII